MSKRTFVVSSVLPLIACVGCEQLLGIENAGGPGGQDQADAGAIPPRVDSGSGSNMPPDGGGGSVACAPLPSFGPVTKYAEADSIALAVGDVNRDGVKDVVVVTRTMTTGEVLVFQGAPGGAFGTVRQLHPGSPTLATGVLVADVDADGSQDIVTWDGMSPIAPMSSFTVSVHRQNIAAAGTFLAAQSFPVTRLNGVVAANLNGDTRTDLVIQSFSPDDTFPFVASTTTPGTFTKGALINTGMTVSHVGDFDQDGLDDVAFTRAAGGLGIAFNDNALSPGTFQRVSVGAGSAANASFGHYTGQAALQDLVLFGDGSPMPGTGVLYAQTTPRVFAQRPALIDGVFGNGVNVPGNGMKTLDLNKDGRDDVVGLREAEIQCPTAETFYPSRNAGAQITFGDPTKPPETRVFTDINGNGKPDLIDLPTGAGGVGAAFVEVWLQ